MLKKQHSMEKPVELVVPSSDATTKLNETVNE